MSALRWLRKSKIAIPSCCLPRFGRKRNASAVTCLDARKHSTENTVTMNDHTKTPTAPAMVNCRCPACKGQGFSTSSENPNQSPFCPVCKGSGCVTLREQNTVPCARCHGSGATKHKQPCSLCNSTGIFAGCKCKECNGTKKISVEHSCANCSVSGRLSKGNGPFPELAPPLDMSANAQFSRLNDRMTQLEKTTSALVDLLKSGHTKRKHSVNQTPKTAVS